jgi:hypothetical protein
VISVPSPLLSAAAWNPAAMNWQNSATAAPGVLVAEEGAAIAGGPVRQRRCPPAKAVGGEGEIGGGIGASKVEGRYRRVAVQDRQNTAFE